MKSDSTISSSNPKKFVTYYEFDNLAKEKTTMDCPNCGETLNKHQIHSVELDECPNCRGLWFDKGEFQKAKNAVEPVLSWQDLDMWKESDPYQVAWSSRKCPKCDHAMATISYKSTGETIDYCPEGHGIWLDEGAFDNIIKALEKEIYKKSSSTYLQETIEEAKELITKPGSFHSEWKDLLNVTWLLQLRVLVENPRLAQALTALQRSSPFQ
jgi:Zn-finger nucleic acid-binding protein